MKTLTLQGKAGYEGRDWSRGALHEQPAIEYATCRDYDGQVLDIAGTAYRGNPQHKLAPDEYRDNSAGRPRGRLPSNPPSGCTADRSAWHADGRATAPPNRTSYEWMMPTPQISAKINAIAPFRHAAEQEL